jgi:hypothetical protein
MSTYAYIDSLIIDAISDGRSPIYCGKVADAAGNLGYLMGREPFRVIDGRLQALRKVGAIYYVKATINKKGGWQIKESA